MNYSTPRQHKWGQVSSNVCHEVSWIWQTSHRTNVWWNDCPNLITNPSEQMLYLEKLIYRNTTIRCSLSCKLRHDYLVGRSAVPSPYLLHTIWFAPNDYITLCTGTLKRVRDNVATRWDLDVQLQLAGSSRYLFGSCPSQSIIYLFFSVLYVILWSLLWTKGTGKANRKAKGCW